MVKLNKVNRQLFNTTKDDWVCYKQKQKNEFSHSV